MVCCPSRFGSKTVRWKHPSDKLTIAMYPLSAIDVRIGCAPIDLELISLSLEIDERITNPSIDAEIIESLFLLIETHVTAVLCFVSVITVLLSLTRETVQSEDEHAMNGGSYETHSIERVWIRLVASISPVATLTFEYVTFHGSEMMAVPLCAEMHLPDFMMSHEPGGVW